MKRSLLVLSAAVALAASSPAFAALSEARDLPVFAVGDATAVAARLAGFAAVRSADGALQDLARLLAAAPPVGGAVLAPGALEPSGDLPALLAGRIEVRALPVYEAVGTAAAAPGAWDAVLIHSPRAGQALSALAPFGGRLAIAISEAAATPLAVVPGLEVRIASRPTEAALLEALGKPAPRV